MSTSPLSGGILSFPKTLIGKSSTGSFTISDTSTASQGGGFTGSFPAASGAFAPTTSTTFSTSYSGFILPPTVANSHTGGQSSISQTYTFTPTTRGATTQSLTFTPSAGFQGTTAPHSTITLSGQGVAPVISLDSSGGTVGNVRIGTTAIATVRVSNAGDGNQAGSGLGNLTGTAVAATGIFSAPARSINLADGGTMSLTYTFAPTAHAVSSTSVTFNTTNGSTDGTNTAQTLLAPLTGTGVGPLVASSVPGGSTLNFTLSSLAQNLVITNATTDADLGALTNLDILSGTLSGSASSMFSISGLTPSTVLTKSQSRNIAITFNPTAGAAGLQTAAFTLLTDDGAAPGQAGKSLMFTLSGLASNQVYWKGGHSGLWNATSGGYNWTMSAGSAAEVTSLPNASTDVVMAASNPGNLNTTLGQDFSIKTLGYVAGTGPMSIAGNNTLTIGSGVTDSSSGVIQTVSAAVKLGATQTWNVVSGGTLSVSGPISGSGAAALVKSGSGTLVLGGSNSYTGGTSVAAGKLQITAAGALPLGQNVALTTAGASLSLAGSLSTAVKLGGLSLAGGTASPAARFDLGNNRVILDKTQVPLAAIRSAVLAGSSSGTWTGMGITSSAAAADATGSNGNTAVGYALNSDPGLSLTTFGGQSVDSNSILLRYTYRGDGNLDGKVGSADFALLRSNFGLASGANWDQADFNGDGKVSSADFALLRANFGKSLPSQLITAAAAVADAVVAPQSAIAAASSTSMAPVTVPEPSALMLLLTPASVSLATALRRRRRQ